MCIEILVNNNVLRYIPRIVHTLAWLLDMYHTPRVLDKYGTYACNEMDILLLWIYYGCAMCNDLHFRSIMAFTIHIDRWNV